ncbi:Retrovirus-related Pol polyprotein from transposon TNT 1-94 [Vitis vinifera]|uniref:Retrovirus-related Pol polyprotein from transposon TNT 1-94 n=1 Tax=Vitis vinifera TaxID=29760 RepID=A0A438D1W2_VITVI|nr:Retrovirus-related Pol polyprotein from transposon TNT 1-94 [Vitis vinifera]
MLSTHFDMKDLGEASYVLGIKILRDRANGVLKLSQRAYIERILKRFNMHNCKSTKAPIVKGDKFSKAQCPQNNDEREEMKTIPYSSVVGSLMYAQVCTRPDIAFVVGMLGRYLSNPGSQHWKAAKKVLRYLQGTKDLMLTYQRTSLLDVVGFCDADFAGCIDDKKSTTGYIFMMAGGVVSWKSVKQTLTTSSTMEAEYVACYEACCHAMWMRNFVSALGVVDSISRPLKLFCDNSATVAFSKNTRSISRSKHIDGCLSSDELIVSSSILEEPLLVLEGDTKIQERSFVGSSKMNELWLAKVSDIKSQLFGAVQLGNGAGSSNAIFLEGYWSGVSVRSLLWKRGRFLNIALITDEALDFRLKDSRATWKVDSLVSWLRRRGKEYRMVPHRSWQHLSLWRIQSQPKIALGWCNFKPSTVLAPFYIVLVQCFVKNDARIATQLSSK